MIPFRKTYYQNKLFRLDGTVVFDHSNGTYIANIEIITIDGELFNQEFDELIDAKEAIDHNIEKEITKIYRRIKDAKDKQD